MEDILTDEKYMEITHPENIVGNMNKQEFEEWLSLGTVDEIKASIKVFNDCEMYEFSAMARDYINNLN